MAAQDESDLHHKLSELLDQFRTARNELQEALNAEERISELGRELGKEERQRELREAAMVPLEGRTAADPERVVAPAKLIRLTRETPEQKEIEGIRERQKHAAAKIQELRAKIRAVLARLAVRHAEVMVALQEFDRLAPYPTLTSVGTIVGLVEEVMGALGPPATVEQEQIPQSAPVIQPERHRARGPDIETSRKRVALEDQLRFELTAIHQARRKLRTLDELKRSFREYRVWQILSAAEQAELLSDEFRPKHYARILVLRVFALTSPETLKKDRRKLRRMEK